VQRNHEIPQPTESFLNGCKLFGWSSVYETNNKFIFIMHGTNIIISLDFIFSLYTFNIKVLGMQCILVDLNIKDVLICVIT